MYRTSPLEDCTRDTLQYMNRPASMSGTKAAKVTRHNPYAMKLLAPEDSVEYNSSILSSPLSARHSPLNWEARAFEPSALYSNLSTPYVGQSLASLTMDAQVRRSLFGDSPATLPVSYAGEPVAVADVVARGSSSNGSSASKPNTPSPGVPASASTATAATATATPPVAPKRALGKVYVGGRPVAVPRYDNEVTVQLRQGEATFVVSDLYSLLALEEETRDLVGLSVIVEGDRGEDLGVVTALLKSEAVAAAASPVKADGEEKPRTSTKALPRVLRVASALELQQSEALPQLEAEALDYCHTCLAEVQLAVPIVVEGVVLQFDRKKLTVRYTSESYVDFNDLTRMLHKKYNCRIWMDQLNRDAVNTTEKRGRRAEHGGRKGSGNVRKGMHKRKDA